MSIILHSDLNNFYASCECLNHPEYKNVPLVVCGKIKDRHGVVLAKNYVAKKYGIKTGDTVFEAERKAPELVAIEAHHDLYIFYSKLVKSIYAEYTDRVESFGIDEAWLDVTHSTKLFGDPEKIANEIRERVKSEIGLTVSIGVSFNKVFAKLGSDIKKPDAVTVISEQNYKDIVWKLNVEDLLFVGRATKQKLNDLGIFTIGDLAKFDLSFLKLKLGKVGETLWLYANGKDVSEVKKYKEHDEVKSVGNSFTFSRNLKNEQEVEALIYMLAESVSARLKVYDVGNATVVKLYVVDENLTHYAKQCLLPLQTKASGDIAETAIKLFKQIYNWAYTVRGVGVSVCNFVKNEQLLLLPEQHKKENMEQVDKVVEKLRSRFGSKAINRANTVLDDDFKRAHINFANITEENLDSLSDEQVFWKGFC